jgi:HlyD family secretion protein
MNTEKLGALYIAPEEKKRPKGSMGGIFTIVILVTGFAIFLVWPRASDLVRVRGGSNASDTSNVKPASSETTASSKLVNNTPDSPISAATGSLPENSAQSKSVPASAEGVILKVSGYIINRERIEISPRFMGTVSWIGVKKGDAVTNGQVVVKLDDAEYRARLHEAEGHLASAKVNVAKASLDYDRMIKLNESATESRKAVDDARLALDSAKAALKETEGSYEIAKTYLDWTVIHSPINGVVLEKLVQPNELVQPQSFGGGKGPSTALIAVADLSDLQVEVDLSEADLSKVVMHQKCRIIPEAYADKVYEGDVAEIAPEADRQKGTLQVKVQIHSPDRFLTPQLSATVEFLKP